tara:strand:- start:278 stop:1864 length:1587 start_codon:yes stop_codon:yes gene_type:complete
VNLFGTDGIRGEVDLSLCGTREAIDALLDERRLTVPLAWLAGQSLARTLDREGASVVIGWDDRPGNPALVTAVKDAFCVAGWQVTLVGPCATPLVHHVLLNQGSTAGIMITASHNPVEDSGLKVFDEAGRKSTPTMERSITRTMLDLAQEDHDLIHLMQGLVKPLASDVDVDEVHGAWLTARMDDLEAMFPETEGALIHDAHAPLLLDLSRGSAVGWLPAWLEANGLDVQEVSHAATAMNRHCGAGELSPGQRWTWAQALQEDHLLLRQVRKAPEGTMLAAALDGDGDRCLMLVAEREGPAVVDGDAMALRLLNAAARDRAWTVAASIESDLALTSRASTMPHVNQVLETAVGDRWLSVALAEGSTAALPAVMGVEDSGHLVLPSRREGGWSLVGDGAASLVAVLLAGLGRQGGVQQTGGWKRRTSIAPSDRSRWTGTGPLAEAVRSAVRSTLPDAKDVTSGGLEAEPNLLLVQGTLDGARFSFGVRNSGTQAKTSLSARTDEPRLEERMVALLQAVDDALRPALAPS